MNYGLGMGNPLSAFAAPPAAADGGGCQRPWSPNILDDPSQGCAGGHTPGPAGMGSYVGQIRSKALVFWHRIQCNRLMQWEWHQIHGVTNHSSGRSTGQTHQQHHNQHHLHNQAEEAASAEVASEEAGLAQDREDHSVKPPGLLLEALLEEDLAVLVGPSGHSEVDRRRLVALAVLAGQAWLLGLLQDLTDRLVAGCHRRHGLQMSLPGKPTGSGYGRWKVGAGSPAWIGRREARQLP